MPRFNVRLTWTRYPALLPLIGLLCGCALTRPVPAPCPAIPPAPKVNLPGPGDLTSDLERILSGKTSAQPSQPSSSSTNLLSRPVDLF